MIARAVPLGLIACFALPACGATAPPVEVQIGASAAAMEPRCAAGERWDGARCVADALPVASGGCPKGTAFVEGGTLSHGEEWSASVRSICMDVTEVTAGAYSECVRRGACDTEGLGDDAACTFGKQGLEEHPINCVSWEQAERYCRAVGRRLPTGTEWTWAAQGGTAARMYPWGDTSPGDQLCWSKGKPRKGTCRVGSFPRGRSAQGLDDMVGNVWEWVSPKLRDGVPNVVGAASWQNGDAIEMFRVNSGNFVDSFVRNDVVGFRCALDAPAGQPRR